MKLDGLHILLAYHCNYECDHCFVWGSLRQTDTLTLEQVEYVLQQSKEVGVTSIYFEGGEPFLYYVVLVKAVRRATDMGFSVGIVSNAYWATSIADVEEWLRPFAGRLADLSVSSDLFHCSECLGEAPQNAVVAAKVLGIRMEIDTPNADDLPRAAQERLFVKITLSNSDCKGGEKITIFTTPSCINRGITCSFASR